MTKINTSLYDALRNFSLPGQLGFGRVMVPAMYRAECVNGGWQEAELLPYGSFDLDPAAKVLHYGQCIFEGMKAYKVHHENAVLFRPLDNWQRMNRSAERLCMPEIPEEIFMDGVSYVTAFNDPFVPRDTGQSLYVRPYMICTSPDLSLAHSDDHSFLVIASPSQAIHAGSMKVFIETGQCRAAIGGTGNVKAGGNYAAALHAAKQAEAKGFHHSLWLDPENRKYIEELSGMNVFAVIDGILHTPSLTGSMLPGITRDSIIQLARAEGMQVEERHIAIDELTGHISSGSCTELFACGTATILAPISLLGDKNDNIYSLPEHYPVADKLRTALLNVQEGASEDKFGWTYNIPGAYYPNAHAQDSKLKAVQK